jgi:LuxR family maltose regulon positive regulatory protein
VLASLEASNLLVVPLDRRREWYRYHRLFRELLAAELNRREPELFLRLHARAAAWFEANNLPEEAVGHAQAAGDADRAARLVEDLAQPAYASGRAETAGRWLGWFEDQGVIERYPVIAGMGAEAAVLLGQPAVAERLAGVVERALAEEALPRRELVEAEMALLRALMCRDGVARMRADTLARQALEIVRDGHLDDYIMSPLVHALAGRTALHRGDVAGARAHLARAARRRPLLTSAAPHLAVQTLLELARGYLTLHDPAGARTVLWQARDILQLRPDLGILPSQAEELQARLAKVRRGTVGPSSLTSAELRLLPLLSTHLGYREIGERLHRSRHTVKSQAMSIYRKLGVSSRGEAMLRLQELGLLGS